jgi:uncharacterized protein (DUF1919 family)
MGDLAIISNNCWGADYYRERGLPYNTPTVGLWFYPDDYLALLSDLRRTLARPLTFRSGSSHGPRPYPVGLLGDIEIQFMHYASEDEARAKWERRVARLPANDEDLLIKICDRDGFTAAHLAQFDALPFAQKIGFLKEGRFDAPYPWARTVACDSETVPDGLTLWQITGQTVNFRSPIAPFTLHKESLRDSLRSREIALIDLPAACSRRIRTTVSTINIPILTAWLNPSGRA